MSHIHSQPGVRVERKTQLSKEGHTRATIWNRVKNQGLWEAALQEAMVLPDSPGESIMLWAGMEIKPATL